MTEGVKRCSRCGEEKERSRADFSPCKKAKDGLASWCKACHREKYHAGKALKPKPQVTPGNYRCPRCKQEKPATREYFPSRPRRENGLSSWCHACARECAAIRRREHNPLLLEEVPSGSKRCSRCKLLLPKSSEYFNRRTSAKSGLASSCRECCKRERGLARLFNGDDLRAKASALYRTNPETKLRILKYQAIYKERVKNDPKLKLRRNIRARQRERRRRAVPGKHSYEQITNLLAEQQGKCFYCSIKLTKRGTKGNEWQVEHFIPVSRGGTHHIENIRIACAACNAAKHKQMPWEWLPDRFQAPPDQQAAD